MEVVLGVSMTPTAVRMVLVEGGDADGVTVDHDTIPIAAGDTGVEQVLAAILGTRDSAVEGGHRLVATGVAWSDHAAAARLTASLREHGLSEVALVSELHAAGALVRAIGAKTGRERAALVLLDGDAATLAVVRSSDGAVVTVRTVESVDDMGPMLAGLRSLPEAPQAVFLIGSGADVSALKSHLTQLTGLPVHAPGDAELALARGAALACAGAPRFEAETVGLAPDDAIPTEAAATQLAAPHPEVLGYSEVDVDESVETEVHSAPEPQRFAVISGAVAALFVVGLIALAVSLAVVVRPGSAQPPGPVGTASLPGQAPAAPETIPAPVPVVQQEPRTVFVTPAPAMAPVSAPIPVPAQAPAPAPLPAQVPAAPAAPAPVVVEAPAPAVPGLAVPAVVGQVLSPFITSPPSFSPSRSTPVRQAPATTSEAPAAESAQSAAEATAESAAESTAESAVESAPESAQQSAPQPTAAPTTESVVPSEPVATTVMPMPTPAATSDGA